LVRGEGSWRRVKRLHPSPFPPFVALRAPVGKPSPTRGEGKSAA
jgi:hypothetical protein